MKLYSYRRSTTSFRVRAALNLKGAPYDFVPVDLTRGEQSAPEFRAINPAAAVPALVLDDGTVLTQSLAILDYLEAIHPTLRLFPKDPVARAKAVAVAQAVALDIHPLNNLGVMGHLKSQFAASQTQCQSWMAHWMQDGFAVIEAMVSDTSNFAFGVAPNIADICITAQVYNAHRWGVDLTSFPNIARIERNCLALPEIAAAHPDQQPDAKANQ